MAEATTQLFCEECGYDLTGLSESRCPECGLEFDPDLLWFRLYRAVSRAIPVWKGVLYLSWPSVGYVILFNFFAWLDWEWLWAALIAMYCIVAFGNTVSVVVRTAAYRAIQKNISPLGTRIDRRRCMLVSFLLFVIQVFITITCGLILFISL